MRSRIAKASVASVAAVGAMAAWNKKLEGGGEKLVSRLAGGEVHYYRWRGGGRGGGDVAYSVEGEGTPLLMVHGIYAGASSFEFRKNFDALSERFRVYALDLLGCGLSEKPRRGYAPEDVSAQIEDFAREEIGKPTHLVASSLSAALSMPTLVKNPRLFKRLVFICPTGYRTLDRPSGRLGDAVYGAFESPILGDSLYHALASRRGIRFYLERMAYHDPAFVTDELVEEYHRASHGRGARHLPAAFASGKLNFPVAGFWPRVPHRTMVCWGREATGASSIEGMKPFLNQNPRTAPRIFKNAALLPHDERSETFNREVMEFLTSKG
ncbi:MAG: alpha/beta fold hydrolase [Rubrobacteraceae bacterium]